MLPFFNSIQKGLFLAGLGASIYANIVLGFKCISTNRALTVCHSNLYDQNAALHKVSGINEQLTKELQDREDATIISYKNTQKKIEAIKQHPIDLNCDKAIAEGARLAAQFNWGT